MTRHVFFIAVLIFIGSGCGPRMRIERYNDSASLMRYEFGPLISALDPISEMEAYCYPLKFEVIDTKDEQLPGQYRWQREIQFIV